MSVYEKVRAYIDDRAIHQAVVAKKANIPADTLNAILEGKQAMYPDDLRAICHALNVCPEAFIECRSA